MNMEQPVEQSVQSQPVEEEKAKSAMAGTYASAAALQRGKRRELVGKVISTKMNKTIAVLVERKFLHPLYKKVVKVGKKYYAADDDGVCKEGDIVRIMETRPLSKLKRWRYVETIKKADLSS